MNGTYCNVDDVDVIKGNYDIKRFKVSIKFSRLLHIRNEAVVCWDLNRAYFIFQANRAQGSSISLKKQMNTRLRFEKHHMSNCKVGSTFLKTSKALPTVLQNGDVTSLYVY